MDVGADTYIENPFSVQYLEACIRNILEIRRHLIEKFSTQPLEPVPLLTSLSAFRNNSAFAQAITTYHKS